MKPPTENRRLFSLESKEAQIFKAFRRIYIVSKLTYKYACWEVSQTLKRERLSVLFLSRFASARALLVLIAAIFDSDSRQALQLQIKPHALRGRTEVAVSMPKVFTYFLVGIFYIYFILTR